MDTTKLGKQSTCSANNAVIIDVPFLTESYIGCFSAKEK
jgi:hypothetical protein